MKSKKITENLEFERTLKRLAYQIVEKNIKRMDKIAFAGILKRGVPLAHRIADIIKEIENIDIPVGELDISLYTDDQTILSTDPMISGQSFDFSFRGKVIVIIDDILNSGRTARAALEAILDRGRPDAVQLCVMADTMRRIYPLSADFEGHRLRISKQEFVRVNISETDGEDSIEIIQKEG